MDWSERQSNIMNIENGTKPSYTQNNRNKIESHTRTTQSEMEWNVVN